MRRAVDPAHLSQIAQHPRVRPFMGDTGPILPVIALEWPEGGVVFLEEAPGVYSIHLLFLPKTRDVIGKVRQALDYLMPDHADTVLADFPAGFKHVRRLCAPLGFKHHHDAHGWAHYVKDDEHGLG